MTLRGTPSAHTPGPWEVGKNVVDECAPGPYHKPYLVSGIIRRTGPEDAVLIAKVYSQQHLPEYVREANARLIAAAPELYEELARIYTEEGSALKPETCTRVLELLAQVQGGR